MADKSILKTYISLIIVIVLWVSIWAITDSFGRIYLKTHGDRIRFYSMVAIAASAVLVIFFPGEMCL
jgi:uncharacterized membrane-anchored protein